MINNIPIMSTCKIKLNGLDDIKYDTKKFEDAIDFQMHITKDIWDDTSSVVIGKKKSYLLHQGVNYQLMGYLHSLSFSIDVIRSRMATKLVKGNKYEIHVKRVKENNVNQIKIYLYEVSPGWIYNGLVLVDKFKITEVPKIEMKFEAANK